MRRQASIIHFWTVSRISSTLVCRLSYTCVLGICSSFVRSSSISPWRSPNFLNTHLISQIPHQLAPKVLLSPINVPMLQSVTAFLLRMSLFVSFLVQWANKLCSFRLALVVSVSKTVRSNSKFPSAFQVFSETRTSTSTGESIAPFSLVEYSRIFSMGS